MIRVDITRFAKFAITPYGIVILTVAMSFGAWLFPSFDVLRKGFNEPEPLLSYGTVLVFSWYGGICLLAWAGYTLGRRVVFLRQYADFYCPLNDVFPLVMVTVIAFIGTGYMIYIIVDNLGLDNILDALDSNQANVLGKALKEDYQKGILSARYCTIIGSGLALYHFIQFRRIRILDILNVTMLILCGLVSNRLSIIAALLFGIGLYVLNTPVIKIHLGYALGGVTAIFLLLTWYNSSRNMQYYEKKVGISDERLASFSEIITYLGAPFQESLSIGNNYEAIVTTSGSRLYSTVEGGLTTNSAFSALIDEKGNLGWTIMFVTVSIISFLMGMLWHHRSNYLGIIYLAWMYCFGEIWRLFMFFRGIVLTLVLAIILIFIITRIWRLIFIKARPAPVAE